MTTRGMLSNFDGTVYSADGVVTKMIFKVKFNSNLSADMGFYPSVNLLAPHYLSNNEFRFHLDTDGAEYGDLFRNKYEASRKPHC